MKRAVVISGGHIGNFEKARSLILPDDYIICADRGALHCDKMGLFANLIAGDFDSCDKETLSNMSCSKNAVYETLLPVKDYTDTEYALMRAYELGYDNVILLGAYGSRIDHSLANIYLLEKMYNLGVKVTLYNDNNRISFYKNTSVTIKKSEYRYVSVIPISEKVKNITEKGFKYSLNNETLIRSSSRAVSNELIGESGEITIGDGSVLIIESVD